MTCCKPSMWQWRNVRSVRAEHTNTGGWARLGRNKKTNLFNSFQLTLCSHTLLWSWRKRPRKRQSWQNSPVSQTSHKYYSFINPVWQWDVIGDLPGPQTWSIIQSLVGLTSRYTLLKIRQSSSTNHGKAQQRNCSFDLWDITLISKPDSCWDPEMIKSVAAQ